MLQSRIISYKEFQPIHNYHVIGVDFAEIISYKEFQPIHNLMTARNDEIAIISYKEFQSIHNDNYFFAKEIMPVGLICTFCNLYPCNLAREVYRSLTLTF